VKTTARDVLLSVAAFFLIAGCSGNGCSCVAPIPGGFPPAERVPNAVQVRVSDTGLAALEADPASLISGLVGTGMGLTFDVPPACGANDNPQICCDGTNMPQAQCGPIDIDLDEQPGDAPRLELNPVAGSSRLDVVVRARVKTAMPLPIKYDTGFTVDCDVNIDTEKSGPNDDLLLTTQINFQQDADANTTYLDVGDVQVSQFDDGDLWLSGSILCDFANLLVGTFTDTLITTFQDAIRSTITDQLCKQCPSGDVNECGGFADSCDNGVCMKGGACYQELGITGRMAASALFGSASPGTRGAIDIYDVAGGYATTDNGGISLGLLGGALPGGKVRDRCGPPATPPADVNVPQSSYFTGNTRPDTGDSFDFAVGLHKHNLDMFSYAAYEGGLLCLTIGTNTIDLLTSDTLAIAMPSLPDLLHGEVSQMFLGLRPQQPPDIVLGLGTFRDEGGTQVIDEPLLDITMHNVDVDFFAQVDDQFIRVMTLNTDIHLPMNLQVTADGQLEPVLGDLDNAFSNITVRNSEALLETDAELADKFPALLSLAVPFIADGLGSFALPELGGLTLRIADNGITAVDNKTFLAIFGTFELGTTMAHPVQTRARLVSVKVPDTAAFAAKHWDPAKRPKVRLELDGDGYDMEWAYRINHGPWSPYTTNRELTLSRKQMWLQGRHRIEVRARERGKPRTTDPTPVAIEALIDTVAPTLTVEHTTPDYVTVRAHDAVSRGHVTGQYRFGSGAWSDPAALPLIIDVEDRDVASLQVRAADEVGNTVMRTAQPIAFHGSGGGSGGCGCTSGSDKAPLGAALLVLVVAFSLRRRRHTAAGSRRRHADSVFIALTLAVGALMPACSCSNSPGNPCGDIECLDGEVDRGPTGRYSAIASEGSRTVVSAYEEKNGDLVLVDVSETGELSIQAVDGVPDDPPTYDPGTYRGGVAQEGEDVGTWTSVALHEGIAHIAYHDVDNKALEYAVETPEGWSIHAVDSGDGNIGLHTSLVVDSVGTPAIAYMATELDDGLGGRKTELRYAQANSPDPRSASDWTITVLDEAAVSCAGLCGDGACLEQQTVDGPAERCVTPTADCPADCASGEVCYGGACVAKIPDPAAYDMPQGVGLFADQAVMADGRRAIVYYDRTNGDLMMQIFDGSWTKQPIDASANSDTGQWASVVADGAGTLHIAYQDALGDQLLYRTWSAGGLSSVEVVDDGVRSDDSRTHPVGASASVFIDSNGEVGVAYQDGATSDLVVSHKTSTGWTREDLLVGPHLDGFFVDTASGAGGTEISSYEYDRGFWPPGDLVITTIP